MLDYYGHHLGIALDRPLVIASLPGGRGDDVAYAIASLTGIAVHHIDEQLMHRLGAGLTESVTQLGLDTVQRKKQIVLQQALERTPTPIIALGDVSLVTEATWNQLHTQTDVVSINWSDLELLSTLKDPSSGMRRQYWQLSDTIATLMDITRRFGPQKIQLRACEHPVTGQGRTALALAQSIAHHLRLEPNGSY